MKIGGWSDKEQDKIFDLMKEHLTSWSGISKGLNGRTENSIKNYFYSTVRRIQACPVIDFIIKVKLKEPTPTFDSFEAFNRFYEMYKLNRLGVVLCNWLYDHEKAKESNPGLYNYLLQTIGDEKKKFKIKEAKSSGTSIFGDLQEPLTLDGESGKEQGAPYLNPKNLNGVHPLLPLALYGVLTNLNAKNLFQGFVKSGDKSPSANSTNQSQSTEPKKVEVEPSLPDLSQISVPVPSNSSYRRKQLIEGDSPSNKEPVQSALMKKALVNMFMSNLSSMVEKAQKSSDGSFNNLFQMAVSQAGQANEEGNAPVFPHQMPSAIPSQNTAFSKRPENTQPGNSSKRESKK